MPHIREASPYLIVRGAAGAMNFYRTVFGADEIFRMTDADTGRIGHAELRVGPMTIMLADEYPELGILSPLAHGGTGTALHLHVDDVDLLAADAVQAGATMVRAPADCDHGERQCRIRDPFGHEWLLGHDLGQTPRASNGHVAARPNLFPALRFRDEHRAMDWLERAFGFARHAVYTDDAGKLLHAELKLGPGILMMGSGPEDTLGFSIYVYVQDLDAHYARAAAAGAEIVRPLADTSYGSREFAARDLDGHVWYFGTYQPVE
ncbi:MAG TPA: VOC family protein [Gemmatimonadales bacterium]|nr:VOC family protein [Gemmatimonadales bacterium]